MTVSLVDRPPLKHEAIADRVVLLRELGMSYEAIARQMGVSKKTVAKAVAWRRDMDTSVDEAAGPSETKLAPKVPAERAKTEQTPASSPSAASAATSEGWQPPHVRIAPEVERIWRDGPASANQIAEVLGIRNVLLVARAMQWLKSRDDPRIPLSDL